MSRPNIGTIFWSIFQRAQAARSGLDSFTRCGSQRQNVTSSSQSCEYSFQTSRVSPCRRFTSSARCSVKAMPPRPKVNEDDITEVYLKGTGPGGQKINKTNSAVQLKHIPTGIVVKIQETRSRSQNRKIARQILAERVEELEKGSESRVAIVAEHKRKKKSSAAKKSRRKYRALEAAKNETTEADEKVFDEESKEATDTVDAKATVQEDSHPDFEKVDHRKDGR